MAARRDTLRGPSSKSEMVRITLRGDSYQRGLQYGKAFGRYLKDFYYWFVKKGPGDLLTSEYQAVLKHHEEATAKHFPQLLEEIKGWSDGSKLPYEMCRIMAFHNDIKSMIRPGCCNVLVTNGPDGPWLAHNTDLAPAERSWQIMKICFCDDCFSHVSFRYVGLPGGMGVNEAGLVVGGASLPGKRRKTLAGLPNFSYYLLSSQDTVKKCCQQLEQLGCTGKGIHLPLLDASGDAVVMEIAADTFHVRKPNDSGVLVAANHSPSGKIPLEAPPAMEDSEKTASQGGRYLDLLDNSWARHSRLTEIVCSAAPEDRTIELAKKALADHQGRQTVCQHNAAGFDTIYSFVISPDKERSRMELCWGPACSGNFVSFEFPPR